MQGFVEPQRITDTDQRATYDELLLIALQPSAVAKSTHVYERVRKYASNTMAATIISGLLVAGYTLFGHFSNPPGAAEFLTSKIASQSEQTALAATSEADVETIRSKRPEVEVFTYPGAQHGFHCDERASYDKASSDIAWPRSLGFFAKYLK